METSVHTKVRSLETSNSKFFISAVCRLSNLRINLRRKGAMCSRRRVETGHECRKDQRQGQSYLPGTNERMVSPSGDARVDERLELFRIQRRRLLQPTVKCKQQKRRPCMLKNWIRKILRRSRILPRVDEWPETPIYQRWCKVQHGKLRTIRCPWFIDELIKHSHTYIFNIGIAGSSSSYIASRMNKMWEYGWLNSGKHVAWTARNRKITTITMETARPYGETRRLICQNGWKNLQRILWTKVFQLTNTHPRVLLVNQLQSREEGRYRANTFFVFTSSLLNPRNVVAQLVTSQPVAVDTTFFSHSGVLGPSRITRK